MDLDTVIQNITKECFIGGNEKLHDIYIFPCDMGLLCPLLSEQCFSKIKL